MNIESGRLDVPTTAENLHWLAKGHVLNAKALEYGLKVINHTPNAARWVQFLNILLLLLGTGFAVSGVFFFFAFNWVRLGHFFKLGLLEAIILIAIGLAFWRGLDNLSGKVALTAAGLFVGALIAVYGQIYQTGADSYQLFLNWALLISGWVLISKFTPMWLLWMLLFNVSLPLYWRQRIGELDSGLYLWMFLLNAIGIVSWEIANIRQIDWLKSRWSPRLLVLPTFVVLVIPTISFIYLQSYTSRLQQDPWLSAMVILLIITSLLVLYVYSQKILDLFMLTICATSLIIVFNVWLVDKVLIPFLATGTEYLLLCLSGILIGQAALVVKWLRSVSIAWKARES